MGKLQPMPCIEATPSQTDKRTNMTVTSNGCKTKCIYSPDGDGEIATNAMYRSYPFANR